MIRYLLLLTVLGTVSPALAQMKKCTLNQPQNLQQLKDIYPEFVGTRNGKDKFTIEKSKHFYSYIPRGEKKALLTETINESSLYLAEKKDEFLRLWERTENDYRDFYQRFARNERELRDLLRPKSKWARLCQVEALSKLSMNYSAPNLLKETIKLTGLAQMICLPQAERLKVKNEILSRYEKFQHLVAHKVETLDRFFNAAEENRYSRRSGREIRLLWYLFPIVHQRMVKKRVHQSPLDIQELRDLAQICRLEYIQYERDTISLVITWVGFAASVVGAVALTPITGGASLLALVGATEGWILGLGLGSSLIGTSLSLFDYSLLSTEMGRIFHQGSLARQVKFYTNHEWAMLREVIRLIKIAPGLSRKARRFLLKMIFHDPYYHYLQEESKRIRRTARIPIHRIINYVTFSLGIAPTVVGFAGLANALNAKPESALRALEEIAEVSSRYNWSSSISATNTAISFANSVPDVVEFLRGLSRPQLEVIYRLLTTVISAGVGKSIP